MRDLQELVGKKVSIHYNLHRCKAGGDPAPGESCFVVKEGGMSSRVSGYCHTFILRDVRLVVQPGGLKRVREEGRRSVMAYYVGTLVAVDVPILDEGLEPLAFNPFKDDSFVLRKDRVTPVTESPRVIGKGRRTWAEIPACAA